MKEDFKNWLETNYGGNVVNTKLSQINKIEAVYGDIDTHFEKGNIHEIIQDLTYSASDERDSKPNSSKINIDGNIRNGLASYKSAISVYKKFLDENTDGNNELIEMPEGFPAERELVSNSIQRQRFALEKDMQKAIRQNISTLDSSLVVIDEGMELAVDTGFIDVTCKDDNGYVVIELKAGIADSRAIGQILGYMGDLHEYEEGEVRGILIAHDFDKKAKAAAKIIPSLTLKKYAIQFSFDDV
jgi:hypothetical protein